MEALILLAVTAWVIKKGVESGHLHWFAARDATRASAKGRSIPRRAASAVQHDVGYWAHQVAHGFPVARRGLADGWHAGRMAQAEGRAGRARAKADHLALRARLIPELRDHRRRQEEALAQIRAARAPHLPEERSEGSPAGLPAEEEETAAPAYSWGLEGARYHWPAGSREEAGRWARHMSTDGRRREVAEYPPGGGPGRTVAAYAGGEPAPAGEEGTGEGASPREPQEPATREGTTMASDTTYDGVLRHVTQAQDFEESAQAERAQWAQQASQIAEDMQALHVDPDTLGAVADYLDAMQEAVKAQQKAMETSQAVKVALERGHKGLSEAHKDAPVEAADREFYAD